MTDYSKLVEALRYCDKYALCNDCPIFETCDGDVDKAMAIAADAIEALQAEMEELKAKKMKLAENSLRFVGKVRELDKRRLEPKRGEWEDYNGHKNCLFKCSVCGSWDFGKYRYCHVCGAKMTEVQE